MNDEGFRAPEPAAIDNATQAVGECNIILGNHITHSGIGEHAYTLHAYFSRFFRVSFAEAVVPGQLNILIDEFVNPYLVKYLDALKRRYPGTRYIILATEFYTPLPLRLFGIAGTFNFFGSRQDWRSLANIFLHQLKLVRGRLNYMYRRYLGFVASLDIADTVLTVHPAIIASLELLARQSGRQLPPIATIYPTIDLEREGRIERLNSLPFGFAMTGSLTHYRKSVVRGLVRAYARSGYDAPVYLHVPFGVAGKFSVAGYPADKPDYLFNFNPPQGLRWKYSSPMRVLRAALLGQIPVTNRKFGDHEIESIAMLWDNSIDTAQRLWSEGTIGRKMLVADFIGDVARYNATAEAKNALVAQACIAGGIA